MRGRLTRRDDPREVRAESVSERRTLHRKIGAQVARIVVVILVVIPIAGLTFLLRLGDELPGTSSITTVFWAHPTPTSEERLPATLHVALLAPPTAIAPQWSGVVTGVAPVGSVIKDGTALLTIGGIARPLCSGPAPMYRPLARGDSGRDVLVARHCVADVPGASPLAVGAPDIVDGPLADSFSQVARRLGASPTSTFDPAWVVWAPKANWKLALLTAAVGAMAPSPGDVVARGLGAASGANVTVINDDGSTLAAAAAGGYRLSFVSGTVELPLDSSGIPLSQALNASLDRLPASTEGSDTGGQPTTPAQSPTTITVTGALVITGAERLVTPVSALLKGQGSVCVLVRRGFRTLPVKVTTRPSSIGTVVIQPASPADNGRITADTEVAINAADVRGVACPG